jgi:acetyl esterase/lipase
MNTFHVIICFLCCSLIVQRLSAQRDTIVIYKKIDTTELKLWIHYPKKVKKRQAAIIFFHGGRWNNGTAEQFSPQSKYLASKGIVAISASYRLKNIHGTTPKEALEDAKSAIRYLRLNAKELHILPNKIAAGGGSAGGHLAAATFTSININDPKDAIDISAKPNSLVLFNPVIDNGPQGYGYEKIKSWFPDISPMHGITKKFPPTVLFLGTKDALIPVSTGELFRDRIKEAGGQCTLFLYEGAGHGFFGWKEGKNPYYVETLKQTENFLRQHKYLK